jgi:hypothetical protein
MGEKYLDRCSGCDLLQTYFEDSFSVACTDGGRGDRRSGCSKFKPDCTAHCACGCAFSSPPGRMHSIYCSKRNIHLENEIEYCFDYVTTGETSDKKSCFITTAVCDILGYKDDCELLMSFRRFRDKILLVNQYEPLVEEYYKLSPPLVDFLISYKNKSNLALFLYNNYLCVIQRMILNNSIHEAVVVYSNMVMFLQFLSIVL